MHLCFGAILISTLCHRLTDVTLLQLGTYQMEGERLAAVVLQHTSDLERIRNERTGLQKVGNIKQEVFRSGSFLYIVACCTCCGIICLYSGQAEMVPVSAVCWLYDDVTR